MEDFYGKKFRKIETIEKNVHDFLFFFFFTFFRIQKIFAWSSFLQPPIFFGNIFAILCRFLEGRGRAQRATGGVGERSEPPAEGLAPAADGGVSASFC